MASVLSVQRRQDGVYLIARVNNIDPRNLRVQWNEHSGVLRVSGFRLPTQKDMVMSRLSGAPTFGRFEITEQFPRNMLNMEEATQQISEWYPAGPHAVSRATSPAPISSRIFK